MIEQRQTELRSAVRLLSEEQDSPQRRQAASELADSQTELRDEIEPLKDKIAEQITAAQQGQPGGAATNADPNRASQMEQAQKVLHHLADEAGSKMAEAASKVSAAAFEDARAKQLSSLDRLNDIAMAMAPFQNVLQRAIKRQEQLTGLSETLTGYDSEAESDDTADDREAELSADEKDEEPSADIDLSEHEYPELALQQSRVADWSRMLSLKAQADLPQVEAQLQTAQEQVAAADDASRQPVATDDRDEKTEKDAKPDSKSSAEDSLAQLEGLKTSLQKAIELGPKVEDHSRAAGGSLEAQQLVAALPDQQQALKLLRKIAESLKKDDQQQQGDDQKHDDQQNQNGDQDQKSQNDQQEKSDQQKQQEQQQKGQSQRERAMSTLRRAREREREHRDLQKQLQQLIGGRIRVDRDW